MRAPDSSPSLCWPWARTSPPRRACSPSPSISYPSEAQALKVAGDASFVASVDEKGTVTAVEVRSVPLRGLGFEEAIEKAVKKWRFEPAVLDGRPRPGRHQGRFSFVLRARDESAIVETVTRFAESWNGSDPAGFAAG